MSVRTDPDGQGLLAEYSVGCSFARKLRVQESTDRVDVSVELSLPIPVDGMITCLAMSRIDSVGGRLGEPLGDRQLHSGGVANVPFDGASLRAPWNMPPGYTLVHETGGGSIVLPPAADLSVTSTWTRLYEAAPADGTGCGATRGTLQISPGPAGSDVNADPGDLLPVTRDGMTVRTGLDRRNGDRLMAFEDAAGGVVVLGVGHPCSDDGLLTQDELFAIALSLARP